MHIQINVHAFYNYGMLDKATQVKRYWWNGLYEQYFHISNGLRVQMDLD